METRKLIQIGSSVGVTLPKYLLDTHNLALGDELVVTTTDNGILIRQPNTLSRHERITKLALNFADRYREDLEALKNK